MGFLAFILGILGGLCTIAGVLTAVEVIPSFLGDPVWATWIFWFALAGILFVAAITCLVAQGRYE